MELTWEQIEQDERYYNASPEDQRAMQQKFSGDTGSEVDYTQEYNTEIPTERYGDYLKYVKKMTELRDGRDFFKDMYDYDIQGAFMANIEPNENMHFPDTYKKPNHETFSVESKYYDPEDEVAKKAGTWSGDEYIPYGTEAEPKPFISWDDVSNDKRYSDASIEDKSMTLEKYFKQEVLPRIEQSEDRKDNEKLIKDIWNNFLDMSAPDVVEQNKKLRKAYRQFDDTDEYINNARPIQEGKTVTINHEEVLLSDIVRDTGFDYFSDYDMREYDPANTKDPLFIDSIKAGQALAASKFYNTIMNIAASAMSPWFQEAELVTDEKELMSFEGIEKRKIESTKRAREYIDNGLVNLGWLPPQYSAEKYMFVKKRIDEILEEKDAKSPEKIAHAIGQGIAPLTEGVAELFLLSRLTGLSGAKLLMLNTESEELSNLDINIASNYANITALASYNNRIYLLDKIDNQIYRHGRSGNAFTKRDPWVLENVDLSKAISLDIDGHIYVLNNDGSILKFLKGEKVDFSLDEISPEFVSPTKMLISPDLEFIYILEPANNRLAIFNKAGDFLMQYKSDKFDNLLDFAVDEINKKIYFLNSNIIYAIEGSHF
jgi:hypothetical protein